MNAEMTMRASIMLVILLASCIVAVQPQSYFDIDYTVNGDGERIYHSNTRYSPTPSSYDPEIRYNYTYTFKEGNNGWWYVVFHVTMKGQSVDGDFSMSLSILNGTIYSENIKGSVYTIGQGASSIKSGQTVEADYVFTISEEEVNKVHSFVLYEMSHKKTPYILDKRIKV